MKDGYFFPLLYLMKIYFQILRCEWININYSMKWNLGDKTENTALVKMYYKCCLHEVFVSILF